MYGKYKGKIITNDSISQLPMYGHAVQNDSSQEEVDKMKADAETNADDDRKRREAVETRNKADNSVYQSEKFLSENGDKVSAEHKQELEDAVKSVQEALKGDDDETIKTTSEKLNEIWQKVSAELYQQAAAAGGDAPQPEGAAPGPDAGAEAPQQEGDEKDDGPIIDAEVVDEKKD